MSNSTRQGGYDERLVVPLEASRRGAHRARTNPLVAALPLLAVVAVVAAVIGVTWALFLRGGGDQTAVGPLDAPTSPAATNPAPSTPAQPSGEATPSVTPSKTPSPSSGGISKSIAITVYNGTTIQGLARRGASALVAEGFKKANFTSNKWPAAVSGTTVFYSKDSQKATAEAVVDALGVGKAEKTTQSTGAGIAVVAGTDARDSFPA
jgi:hypothetical protein